MYNIQVLSVFLLHYFMEVNIVILLFYMYLKTLFTSYTADYMMHSQ